MNILQDKQIGSLPTGRHGDGAGLYLVKRDDGLRGQWVLRITIRGKRRDMGLGSADTVSLKRARDLARTAREAVMDGRDPIEERKAAKRALLADRHLLADVAQSAFEARKAKLKNGGVNGRWFSPLELHVLPKLGSKPVSEITQHDIVEVLAPIWKTKAETARKAINRLNICLEHAAAFDVDVDLQAITKAKKLLGEQEQATRNTPSVHWRDVPDFYASISEPTPTLLALRFLILTAARSGEVRGMTADEIEGDVWIVPAARMKGKVEHRVPLSREAADVLRTASQFSTDRALFPGVRGGPISDATMSRYMERRGMVERPHGFRSSFRTWCAEQTDTPREIAETALAHVAGGKVELAYRRTDYLERRRELMERWARFVVASGE